MFHTQDSLGVGQGTYEVRVQKEGDKSIHLSFIVIDDPDSTRARDLTAGMTRVEN